MRDNTQSAHFTRREVVFSSIGLLASASGKTFAQAGSFPARPINLIVAYPPGGGNDISARIVTQPLSGYWNQPVIVDNRAGANGAIGAQLVAKAQPDGYSLLLLTVNHVILPSLKSDVAYNVERDFAPISLIATYPFVLVVNASSSFKTVGDLLSFAKSHPKELSFGSSGAGGGGHLAGELFCAKAGIKMLHVPYKGDSPALTDLMGGQISCMFCSTSSGLPFIRGEKIRPLGVSTLKRSSLLPNVPSIAESGVPGYESTTWVGVVAPAATSVATIDKLNQGLRRAMDESSVKSKIVESGGEVIPGTPQEFKNFIEGERLKWSSIIKQSNIQLE